MIELFKKHKNIIIVAFFVSFFSGIGQTYLLALYNPSLKKDLGLSDQELSQIYSLATFVASLFLPYVGRLIDRYSMKNMVISVASFLACSLVLMGSVGHIWQLLVAYFLVRLLGQSSLTLTATANISKAFGSQRGKVLAIGFLGRSFSEGSLPALVVYFLTQNRWQSSLYFLALSLIVVLCPLTFFLLKNSRQSNEVYYEESENVKLIQSEKTHIKDVLRDYKIYLLSLCNVTLPFLMTGIYFHSNKLLTYKDWTLEQWAFAFSFYAISQLAANLSMGIWVDRFSAVKMIQLKFLPLIIGLLILNSAWSSPVACYVFLSLCGMSVGFSANSKNAMMAELFGLKVLGEIKGIDASLMVISTSIAPVLFSYLFDHFGFSVVLDGMLAYVIIMNVLLAGVLYLYKKQNRAEKLLR
ncbi:MAG: MFS transporter [Halobacteriovoraceae bacterium]|nr:MFS transporter [Halobacteriovoraceae bacterium]